MASRGKFELAGLRGAFSSVVRVQLVHNPSNCRPQLRRSFSSRVPIDPEIDGEVAVRGSIALRHLGRWEELGK